MGRVVNTEQVRQSIGENLRRLLDDRGWSQALLAGKIFGEVAQSQRVIVSRWVNGKAAPSAADLLNLAEAFGISAEEIARPKKRKKSA